MKDTIMQIYLTNFFKFYKLIMVIDLAKLIIIAAVGKTGELGKKGKLIWRLKKDMKFFKSMTMGKKIVMGYNTYLSMPPYLPGREYIVLTHKNIEIKGAKVFQDFMDLREYLDSLKEEVYIVGGASIYKLFIDLVDELKLTYIDSEDKQADVYFPKFDKNLFTEEIIDVITDENPNYKIIKYTRKE